MTTRRTTLAADPHDLALLQDEARRRGVSLAQLLRELVASEATKLRRERRPRFGVVHTGARASQESVDDEGAPIRVRHDT